MPIQSRGLVWARQPQAPLRVGESTLAQGIGLVLLPAHNGFDYINGKTFAKVSGATFGTTQAYGGSRSHKIITSSTDAWEASAALGLGSSVTTLATVVVPGTLGTTVNLFGVGNSASLPTRNRTGLRIGSTGLAEAYAIGATGTTGAAASSVSPTVGQANVIVGLFSGTASRRVALNGVISAAETTSATATGINTTSIGSMAGSSRLAGQVGDYLLAVAWSRVLSDGEVLDFCDNPWQIFRLTQRRYFLPALVTHTTTGALAAGSATIAGTAAHQHAATGALAASAATVAGTAAHLTLHTTTGALSASAATVSGAAAHQHAATGALAAQAATIAGTADHTVPSSTHTTTGALAAQAATISGTAAHQHATTGALAASAATIAGTAAHLTLHATSGALVAQAATIEGAAVHGSGAAVTAGGDDDDRPRRRRKYIVRDGDQLLVFEDQRRALAAQKALDQWQAAQARKPAQAAPKPAGVGKGAAPAPRPSLPRAAQVVPLPDLDMLAVATGQQQMLADLIRLQDFERAVGMWQQLLDDEDDELAMLLELA